MGTSYIMHHGVKGQKWGVRRYQNPDGTWKSGEGEAHRKAAFERFQNGANAVKQKASVTKDRVQSALPKKPAPKPKKELTDEEKAARVERNKRIAKNVLIAAGAVAVTSAAVYGAYKYKQSVDKVLEQNINIMMDESNRINDKFLKAKGNYENMLKNSSYTDEQRQKAKEVRDALETLNYNKRYEVSKASGRNQGGVRLSTYTVKEDLKERAKNAIQDRVDKRHGVEFNRKESAEKVKKNWEDKVIRARNTIDQNPEILATLMGDVKADKVVYEKEWMNKVAEQNRKRLGNHG